MPTLTLKPTPTRGAGGGAVDAELELIRGEDETADHHLQGSWNGYQDRDEPWFAFGADQNRYGDTPLGWSNRLWSLRGSANRLTLKTWCWL